MTRDLYIWLVILGAAVAILLVGIVGVCCYCSRKKSAKKNKIRLIDNTRVPNNRYGTMDEECIEMEAYEATFRTNTRSKPPVAKPVRGGQQRRPSQSQPRLTPQQQRQQQRQPQKRPVPRDEEFEDFADGYKNKRQPPQRQQQSRRNSRKY
eukprot:TRINITY_DN2457_c0_g1_i2.p1 TRINITY_DN2457_c0_g1~~TRINITY_DN2457_c0_g1_i2.p1  ORF type:complete len:151 (-),score=25.24 TRINITY_DN2457_c0_g1_i2:54-506(-)